MSAIILDSAPGLSDVEIAALERDLDVRLPPAYREFLRAHDGGYPDPNVFEREDDRRSGRTRALVAEFLTAEELRTYRSIYDGRIPRGLLVVGHDPGGNALLLGTEGDAAGRVYFWDHDFEHDPPSFANVFSVADDFASFLASLREPDDD